MKVKHIIALFLSFTIAACDTYDFGDINDNRNGASNPYPAGLLAGSIMSFANRTGRVGLMQPTLYVQYQAQVTYTAEMLYNEVPTGWNAYYNIMLQNLKTVIDVNSDPAQQNSNLLAQGAPENQIGVAMIFQAVVLKRITDTWGDVPFSQALKGGLNVTPGYDTQEDIYKALITNLKAGRDMLNAGKPLPTGDILYFGDVDMWKKLANSLIMQMAITLSKRYPAKGDYAEGEFTAALNDGNGIIDEVSEEAWFTFEDKPGFRNPWNQNRTPDYFLTREFTDALNGNATAYNRTSNTTFDSRLKVYADDYTKPGVPYGYELGSGAGASSVSNDNYWNNTTPLPLMTASYVYLNRSHAAELGWTTEVVTDMLRKGIELSYETLDSHFGTDIGADAAAYADARVLDAGTFGNMQVIAEEKWVSLFGMGFEAWTEWRITGYPDLLPATDFVNNGEIPRRYLYPTEEATLNQANYNDGVGKLSPTEDRNYSRVWWDN